MYFLSVHERHTENIQTTGYPIGLSDYYYFSATDEQINALNNASIPFEKQTKADGSMVIRVATDDKSKAEAIMNSKNLIL